MYRFFFCLLIGLFSYLPFYGQTYIYTDKELPYTDWREKVTFVNVSDQIHHLLKWGRGGITINVYDKELQFRYSKHISGTVEKLTFLYFEGFYYAIATNSVKTKVYAVNHRADYTDKTEEVTDQLWLNKAASMQLLTQTKNQLFFTQQVDDAERQITQLKIKVLDSSFNPVKEFNRDINYINGHPPHLTISSVKDDLLILQVSKVASTAGLTVTKLDVTTGHFKTKRFVADGLHFLSHQLIPQDSTIILQSRVSEWGNRNITQTYSYFIKMTHELDVESSLFLDDSTLKATKNPNYYFRPVMTMPLNDKEMLLVDYGRTKKESTSSKGMLRYVWIDSALTVRKEWSQATTNYRYIPSLLLTNGNKLHVYYQEKVREGVTLVNTYELKEEIYNDQSLQLNPKYSYQLAKATPLATNSFIMPYINKARVGLVKVQLRNP